MPQLVAPLPVPRTLRETIGAPPATLPARPPRAVAQRLTRPRSSPPARWRTAGRVLATTALRLIVASVLAVLVTASIWAVELAMRNEARQPAAQTLPSSVALPSGASTSPGLGAAVPSAAAAPRIYVVRAGDTLRGIARRMLGDEVRWTEIVDADGDRIDDPNNLRIGSELRLPAS